jgi:hypothetical protein
MITLQADPAEVNAVVEEPPAVVPESLRGTPSIRSALMSDRKEADHASHPRVLSRLLFTRIHIHPRSGRARRAAACGPKPK